MLVLFVSEAKNNCRTSRERPHPGALCAPPTSGKRRRDACTRIERAAARTCTCIYTCTRVQQRFLRALRAVNKDLFKPVSNCNIARPYAAIVSKYAATQYSALFSPLFSSSFFLFLAVTHVSPHVHENLARPPLLPLFSLSLSSSLPLLQYACGNTNYAVRWKGEKKIKA